MQNNKLYEEEILAILPEDLAKLKACKISSYIEMQSYQVAITEFKTKKDSYEAKGYVLDCQTTLWFDDSNPDEVVFKMQFSGYIPRKFNLSIISAKKEFGNVLCATN